MSTYSKLTPIEHVLKRPTVYIGSITPETKQVLNYDKGKLHFTEETVIPGLLKLFDEVIGNVIDQTNRKLKVPVTEIKIDINKEYISVYNNGSGIPFYENGVCVPEMIFSELLSGSNYNDQEDRYLIGLNGLGIKLVGIFSDYFEIELVTDSQKYLQRFTENLRTKSKIKITDSKKQDSVQVKFKLNTDYFKCDLPISQLITKCILLLSILNKNIKLTVNGTKYKSIELKTFIFQFLEIPKAEIIYFEQSDWKVAIFPGAKKQISFVNGEFTELGGKHVDYIFGLLAKEINTKKKYTITASEIQNSCVLYLISKINQPQFNSQTKDYLNTAPSKFGISLSIPSSFVNAFIKSSIFSSILEKKENKENSKLSKLDGKKKTRISVPKLDDANFAGTKKSNDCTLFLTEGDSAKTFVVSGFSVIKRDFNGVFPLRGKMLNAREATKKQLLENSEISSLKKILGLEQFKKYSSTDSLRYGKICIVADQDLDGFHCLSLVFNMIHFFWPELLALGFISYMNTPLIKGTFENKRISFYSEKEFNQFKNKLTNVKYFKGLGSSTKIEAQECFQNKKDTTVNLKWTKNCEKAVQLAFSKNCISDRKNWLTKYNVLEEPGTLADTFDTFINNKLVQFSSYDCVRSIPDLVDGLKPSQRKVMYIVLKRNITQEIKVAQLGASCSEQTGYKHGENSLFGTIINMAQDYPGSNNMNLLEPCGQFGSRLLLGSDSASPRYIFTRMNENTKKLFDIKDLNLNLLEYLVEENKVIEPVRFYPRLPIVLINGTQGIGSGFSCFIPQFNPIDLKNAIKCILNKKKPQKLVPWYRNFNGTIEPIENSENFTMVCKPVVSGKKLIISEIPIGIGITNFKENLEELQTQLNYVIKTNNSTENTVYFELVFENEININAVMTKFKLTKKISLDNMHLFLNGKLKKFDTVFDILEKWISEKIKFIKKKKEILVLEFECEIKFLNFKIKFISDIISEKLIIFKKPKKEIAVLMAKEYPETVIPKLLGMNLFSFSLEEIEKLENQLKNLVQEKELLDSKSIKTLFLEEIE